MKHLLVIAALLGTSSLTACAQAPQPGAIAAKPAATPAAVKADSADGRARQALQALNPQIQIDYIGASALPGFREAIVGGQVVLVSDDGRYLVQGQVLDMQTKKELTQGSPALGKYRRGLLDSIKVSDRIVFSPANPKYTVDVFTDVECGYCRKFHTDIAEYTRRGIRVEYLAFPRAGIGSPDYRKMVAVWCAPDRRKALTDAKSDRPLPKRSCPNPVADEYALGQRAGLEGTPMILAEDGTVLGGYLPPDQLLAALDELDAGQTPVASTATGGK